MRTRTVLAISASLVLIAPGTSRGQVVNFDDIAGCSTIGAGFFVPAGYAGFTWGSLWTCYSATAPGAPAEVIAARVSGTNVAYNRSGSGSFIKRLAAFDFTSAYLTGQGTESYDIQGWLGGAQLHSYTFSSTGVLRQFITFNWTGIDQVKLVRTSGGGAIFWDDINFTRPVSTVPEPASLALVASGLAGLAGVARRRRRMR